MNDSPSPSVEPKKSKRKTMISFRGDEEVLAALARLEAAVGSDVIHKRRRSVALRRAVLEADERLQAAEKK